MHELGYQFSVKFILQHLPYTHRELLWACLLDGWVKGSKPHCSLLLCHWDMTYAGSSRHNIRNYIMAIKKKKLSVLLLFKTDFPTSWQGIYQNCCSFVRLFVPKPRPSMAANELLPCCAVATCASDYIQLIPLNMVLNTKLWLPNTLLECIKSKLPH